MPAIGEPRIRTAERTLVARYQEPNPLDVFFFAADRAMRRIGLPGAHVQLCLELRGQIDVAGLKHALAAVCRAYPAAGSRLECSPITGRPRWRLDAGPPDLERVVHVHHLAPATHDECHHQMERLLASPIAVAELPPLRFHVLRGLPCGDRVVFRWPHAFMDGRGGVTLLEETQRLYHEKPDPRMVNSLGDESRNDFNQLLASVGPVRSVRLLLTGMRTRGPGQGRTVRFPDGPALRELGPVRYLLSRFSPEQTRQAKEASLRLCGVARFGDFVRACAVRSLHRVMPGPLPPRAAYCTLNLIDHRKRRHRSPVCRNLTNALPLHVPARLAPDRRATADAIREQTAQLLASGALLRRLATVRELARLPTGLLAGFMHRSMVCPSGDSLPAGMGSSPSLPLGFIGSFARDMPTFCGAELVNIYGLRPVPFQTGLSVDMNEARDRFNVAVMFYEKRVPLQVVTSFLDDFVEGLLDPS